MADGVGGAVSPYRYAPGKQGMCGTIAYSEAAVSVATVVPFVAGGGFKVDDRLQALRADLEQHLRNRAAPARRKKLPTDSKTVSEVLAANQDPRYVLFAFPEGDRTLDRWRVGKPDDVLGEVHLAATGLWIVDALEDPSRSPREREDLWHFLGVVRTHLLFPDRYAQVHLATDQVNGAEGGRRGAGKQKNPQNQLFRRALIVLLRAGKPTSPTMVRTVIKAHWRQLANDFGDPLPDIVEVTVNDDGTDAKGHVVFIEYTERYANRLGIKRSREITNRTLERAITRILTDLSPG